MKLESHPYGIFLPSNPCGLIIGSFPIGKFSDPSRQHEIKKNELRFFFGGEKNLLWKLVSHARNRTIKSETDVVEMLEEMHLGIGDLISSCRRKKGGGSDADLYDITFNTGLLPLIREHRIKTVYFTSRKVEAWFNRLFPDSNDLKKISLISPSAQTLRSLGKNADFQNWRLKHPNKASLDFIYESYQKIFSKL